MTNITNVPEHNTGTFVYNGDIIKNAVIAITEHPLFITIKRPNSINPEPVLTITPEGEYKWASDAGDAIANSDFTGLQSLKQLLLTLRKIKE